MTHTKIRVAILEDHQSIIDGYMFRLSVDPRIEVVATAYSGEEIESVLQTQHVDVLLLDVQVPVSQTNKNSYPIKRFLSKTTDEYPNIGILAISMHTQPILIESLVEAGITGYIFKHDHDSIQQLAKIVHGISKGEIYFSEDAYKSLRQLKMHTGQILSPRQIEALSLCVAYPDLSSKQLADMMKIAHSTLRNLLSSAYLRMGVSTRAAATAKAQQLGLFPQQGSSFKAK